MEFTSSVPLVIDGRDEKSRNLTYELTQNCIFIFSELCFDAWRVACNSSTTNAREAFARLREFVVKKFAVGKFLPMIWEEELKIQQNGVLAIRIGTFGLFGLERSIHKVNVQ